MCVMSSSSARAAAGARVSWMRRSHCVPLVGFDDVDPDRHPLPARRPRRGREAERHVDHARRRRGPAPRSRVLGLAPRHLRRVVSFVVSHVGLLSSAGVVQDGPPRAGDALGLRLRARSACCSLARRRAPSGGRRRASGRRRCGSMDARSRRRTRGGPTMYWQRGTLTPEQVQLVIRNLPLDVSFADEDDVLVYWSGPTYKTCDSRYIGRDVRDCHPEHSLDVLEDILTAVQGRHEGRGRGLGAGRRALQVHALHRRARRRRRLQGHPRGQPRRHGRARARGRAGASRAGERRDRRRRRPSPRSSPSRRARSSSSSSWASAASPSARGCASTSKDARRRSRRARR